MDFSLTPEMRELQARTRRFINEVVIPVEKQMPTARQTETWDSVRRDLIKQAREAKVFLPQMSEEYGGLGLNWVNSAVIFEEAGRSVLGIQALNIAAPDEGNMHMMEIIATPEQKERYLKPLAAGEIRSNYAMTEPAPGTGADPSLLKTTAVKKGDRWVINGKKWFISGAEGSAFSIAMVKTGEVNGRHGATMFLVDADNPGYQIKRRLPINDTSFIGGHGEIDFVDCEVGEDAVLGKVNEGFDYAQVRLRPARLTHCMRWLGAARRAVEIALEYASRREAFGTTLSQHQAVQWMLADSEIEMHAARLMILHAAWMLDRGERAARETSIAKVFVAETVNKVADRAVQIMGAQGIYEDSPLANIYRETRHFRIYDGPSEVHRMSVSKRMFRQFEAGTWGPTYD